MVVELARGRSRWSEFWCARVRARRREERFRARSSSEGGSPKMKNLMKKNIRRAMESWPRRKPCVKERLRGSVGLPLHCGGRNGRTRRLGGEVMVAEGPTDPPFCPYYMNLFLGLNCACPWCALGVWCCLSRELEMSKHDRCQACGGRDLGQCVGKVQPRCSFASSTSTPVSDVLTLLAARTPWPKSTTRHG